MGLGDVSCAGLALVLFSRCLLMAKTARRILGWEHHCTFGVVQLTSPVDGCHPPQELYVD